MPNSTPDKRCIARYQQIIQVRIALGVGIGLFLLATVSGIYRLVQMTHFFPDLGFPLPDLEPAIEIGFYSGLFVVWQYVSLCFWQRVERYSFASETDESTTRQDHLQPVLLIPQTITIRLKRIYIWFWAILGLLASSPAPLVEAFLNQQRNIVVAFLPVIGFVVLLIIAISGLLISQGFLIRRAIKITEDGLEAQWGNIKSIQWQDARLFACYKLPRVLGYETFIYELSGETSAIFWYWLSKPQSPFTVWKPELPVEKYHEQMQALCAFVIEKTRLPLHNF